MFYEWSGRLLLKTSRLGIEVIVIGVLVKDVVNVFHIVRVLLLNVPVVSCSSIISDVVVVYVVYVVFRGCFVAIKGFEDVVHTHRRDVIARPWRSSHIAERVS